MKDKIEYLASLCVGESSMFLNFGVDDLFKLKEELELEYDLTEISMYEELKVECEFVLSNGNNCKIFMDLGNNESGCSLQIFINH